jgi:hypothetical protein
MNSNIEIKDKTKTKASETSCCLVLIIGDILHNLHCFFLLLRASVHINIERWHYLKCLH